MKSNLDYCPDDYIYCGVFLRPVATKLPSDYYIRQPAYDEYGKEMDSDHFAVYKKHPRTISDQFDDYMSKIRANTTF